MDKPDEKKVLCPWCGGEMDYEQLQGCGYYECAVCGAESPRCKTEVSAYTAAMKRYEPPNHIMTLDEVNAMLANRDPVALELAAFPGWEWCSNASEIYHKAADDDENYGITWRCWSRKPTDEERAAAPWEE